jgi:hypothetical protein
MPVFPVSSFILVCNVVGMDMHLRAICLSQHLACPFSNCVNSGIFFDLTVLHEYIWPFLTWNQKHPDKTVEQCLFFSFYRKWTHIQFPNQILQEALFQIKLSWKECIFDGKTTLQENQPSSFINI